MSTRNVNYTLPADRPDKDTAQLTDNFTLWQLSKTYRIVFKHAGDIR